MYNPVGVSKLSENQKSRLRNGHPVRIKKGTANKLHLTKEQIKKLESASRRGAGYTVTLNPEQAEKHGAGLFGDIATKAKKFANKHKDLINPIATKAVKSSGHKGLQKIATSLHNKINSIPELSGEGVKKRRRGRPSKKGEGIFGDVLGMINPTIGTVAKAVGLGIKKTRKPRTKKGKGVISDMAKSGLKALAPVLIDAASSAAKNKISGMGTKKRVGRPRKTKAGRPRKTRTGGALYPAGC